MSFNVAVVDKRITPDMERALFLRGFRVVALPPSERLSAPIASHTDMLMIRLGDNIVTTADYCERALGEITEIYDIAHPKFHFADELHGSEYPNDVIFNALVLAKTVYARLSSLSPYVKRLARELGYTLKNVNQGYPACTVLKLSDEAVITADRGMARTLEGDGIRVYLIEDGGISLPPYEYGFIGGTAGVFNNKVYFLGDIARHKSYEAIKAALDCEGLSAVALSGDVLVDLGGILFMQGNVD